MFHFIKFEHVLYNAKLKLLLLKAKEFLVILLPSFPVDDDIIIQNSAFHIIFLYPCRGCINFGQEFATHLKVYSYFESVSIEESKQPCPPVRVSACPCVRLLQHNLGFLRKLRKMLHAVYKSQRGGSDQYIVQLPSKLSAKISQLSRKCIQIHYIYLHIKFY